MWNIQCIFIFSISFKTFECSRLYILRFYGLYLVCDGSPQFFEVLQLCRVIHIYTLSFKNPQKSQSTVESSRDLAGHSMSRNWRISWREIFDTASVSWTKMFSRIISLFFGIIHFCQHFFIKVFISCGRVKKI